MIIGTGNSLENDPFITNCHYAHCQVLTSSRELIVIDPVLAHDHRDTANSTEQVTRIQYICTCVQYRLIGNSTCVLEYRTGY